MCEEAFENDWFITTLEDCWKIAEEAIKLGFNAIQYHSSSLQEDEFLEQFGKKVLPNLKERYKG